MRDRTLDDWDQHRAGTYPKPLPVWLWSIALASLALAFGHHVWEGGRMRAAWWAQARAQAEATCQENPETFMMYPIGGAMPMGSQYEYCVAAYVSHMPAPD